MIHKTNDLLKRVSAKTQKYLALIPLASVLITVFIGTANYILITPVKQEGLADLSLFTEESVDSSLGLLRGAAYLNSPDGAGEFGVISDAASGALLERESFTNTTPSTSTKAGKGSVLIYKVGKGETLSSISKTFGVSVNTILWANNLKSSYIRPGDELIILPVSGVMHEVKAGETVQSIAEIYGVMAESITAFNKTKIAEGETIIIPNGKPVKGAKNVALLDISNYLIMPVKNGLNWGKLHQNAVDISASCGEPVFASAEGLVESVGKTSEFNNGLGGFIKIQHPLGDVETLYAYTSENLVSVGDYVDKGDLIAKIGNTGKAEEPSGCHLHFGVFGAKHPFAK